MKKYIKIGIVLILLMIGMQVATSASKVRYVAPVVEKDLIEQFAEKYGSDPIVIKSVIKCESGGDHSKISDSGYSKGVAQFFEETFYRMAKLTGEDLSYESEYDQIKLLSYAMAHPELAREWTSWVAIQKGGSYAFYSRINKKHYIVKCKLINQI